MNLKELAEKYFIEENHNCAESVFRAAGEYYGLGVTPREVKVVGAYGAGMQTGNTCGAILGAVATLSVKYVETVTHVSTDVKPAVTLLINKFNEKFGNTMMCKDIKPKYFVEGKRCLQTVLIACDVLEEVFAEYKAE